MKETKNETTEIETNTVANAALLVCMPWQNMKPVVLRRAMAFVVNKNSNMLLAQVIPWWSNILVIVYSI